MTLRKRIYLYLNYSKSNWTISRWVEGFLMALIFANIIAIVLESVAELHKEYSQLFQLIEIISVSFFIVEYILRLWTIVEDPRYKRRIRGRLKYSLSTIALIDLISILPSILHFLSMDLLFIRIVRLFRLLRILKITRYLRALNLIESVLKERREQLMVSILFILFLLVFVSTLMFYVENSAQPEKFASIPASMWWGIATLTTVGYGDMVPITPLGRILGGMIAILGVGLFALPAGILSSGLTDQLKPSKKKHKCPHCGGEFHD